MCENLLKSTNVSQQPKHFPQPYFWLPLIQIKVNYILDIDSCIYQPGNILEMLQLRILVVAVSCHS